MRCSLIRKSNGEIAIVCDPDAKMITFRDTGIGMNRHDIRQFLTVIGSTGTGTARQHLREAGQQAAYDGQFGIGMLSAFVVATRVVVRTRKLEHFTKKAQEYI